MKQHHLTQTLLQWLLLGFIAAPLLAGCNDSDDKGNPDPTPNPPAAVTFTVTLGVYDQQGVSAKVVPSDETASWYCNLFEAAALGDLSDTTISELLEGIRETAPYLHTGTEEFTLTQELTPGTEYRLVVAGHDAASGFTGDYALSEPILIEAPSEPEPFTFEVMEVTYNSASILVKPLDTSMPYFIDVRDAASVDAMGDEKLIEEMLKLYGGSMSWLFSYTGETTISSGVDFGSLQPDTEYYVSAFGYDENQNSASTKLSKMKFSSAAAGDPTKNTFSFEITDVSATGADVTVKPSDQSVLYIWDVITEQNYQEYGGNDEALRKYLDDYIKSQINATFPTREDIVAVCAVRGDNYYFYESLRSNTTYYVWAICVDASGQPMADPALSPSFTTAKEVISTATAKLVFGKYYDGSELYKLDPETYEKFNGKAYVPATVEHSADATTWYTIYTSDNIMDTESYPDALLRPILIKQGSEGVESPRYAVPWDTEVYFLAMAKDAAGNYGPVFRKSLSVDKAGASPVSELSAAHQSAAKPLRTVAIRPQLIHKVR